MWRWLRRLYMLGMALLPFGMWWGFRTMGISLRAFKVTGGVPLGVVVVPWWIGWETAVLAAWMEWKNEPTPPPVPVRGEIGLWLLYSFMGAFVGWFFALWLWLTVATTNGLIRLAPSALVPWGNIIGGMVGLIWFVLLMWGVMWLAETGVTDLFRRTIRRVLGVQVSDEKILHLLERAPLDAGVKAQFAARIRTEGMSVEVAEALQDALWETGQTGSVALQLDQALRNWLEEREG